MDLYQLIKRHTVTVVIVILSMSCVNGQPVLEEGWPIQLNSIDNVWTFNNLALYSYNDTTIIGLSSNYEIALMYEDGTFLNGWPIEFTLNDDGIVTQGPRIGDICGDDRPEIVFSIVHNDYRYLKVYDYEGNNIEYLQKSIYLIPGEDDCVGSPVLVDLDGDFKDEMMWVTNDSIYVVKGNNENFQGFPWSTNDSIVAYLSSVCVGMGELWPEEEPVLFWLTGTGIHAKKLNGETEISGYPVSIPSYLNYASVSLIPIDESWVVSTVSRDSIYVFDSTGESLPGFPIENYVVGISQSDSYDVIVGDLDGDNSPDLLFSTLNRQIYGYCLNNPDNPAILRLSVGQTGSASPPVLFRTENDPWGVVSFGGYRGTTYQDELQSYRNLFPLEGYPVIHDTESIITLYSETAFKRGLLANELITYFYVRTDAKLYKYRQILDNPIKSIEWQMPGNNAGGNRFYSPIIFDNSSVEEEKKSLPEKGSINVYPNPGNSSFRFEINNVSGSETTLTVLDVLGREVYKSESIILNGGTGIYHWDCSKQNLPSGTYYAQIEGQPEFSQKIILLQ